MHEVVGARAFGDPAVFQRKDFVGFGHSIAPLVDGEGSMACRRSLVETLDGRNKSGGFAGKRPGLRSSA
jgi:hypothetical protein